MYIKWCIFSVLFLLFTIRNANSNFYQNRVEPTLLQLMEVKSFAKCQAYSVVFNFLQQYPFPESVYHSLNIPRYPITEKNVTFVLITRQNPTNGYELNTYEDTLAKSPFDPTKPTIVYGPGQQRSYVEVLNTLSADLLPKEDLNIIIINFDSYTYYNEYYNRNNTVPRLGSITAKFLKQLITFGANPEHIYLIGFSSGAEAIALAAKQIVPKIGRLLVFDPAGSCFSFLPPSRRVSKEDARFVEIVHCTTGDHGDYDFRGHATFYMNGGYTQPNCENETSLSDINKCSHVDCQGYFFDTVRDFNLYYGVYCDSYGEYLSDDCDCRNSAVMGYATPANTSGTYYVNTVSPKPCKFGNGVFTQT